ncbi:hypothetical protein FKM82_003227 [Ascaphus truei]
MKFNHVSLECFKVTYRYFSRRCTHYPKLCDDVSQSLKRERQCLLFSFRVCSAQTTESMQIVQDVCLFCKPQSVGVVSFVLLQLYCFDLSLSLMPESRI